jgi:uncharacterized protein DUF6519
MKGDFTRNTFNPLKHFTRVLMQQGRVQLDADWNEQAAILLHYLQTLAADLIGPHGGPTENLGFGIVDVTKLSENEKGRLTELKLLPLDNGDFLIGKGHYYVNGVLCENDDYVLYSEQPDLHVEPLKRDTDNTYLVYLDVWERHITYLEDGRIDDPNIREVALGGPDTATRAKVVWQVKVLPVESGSLDNIELKRIQSHPFVEQRVLLQVILELMIEKLKSTPDTDKPSLKKKIEDFKGALATLKKGRLRARAHIDQASADPCTISPDARYRGVENQLYRVEVHRSGGAWDKKDSTQKQAATFKWSRENGSVVFPISQLVGDVVTLKHLGRDSRFGLAVGDWVEIVDDDYVFQNRLDPLLKVKAIDPLKMQVTLDGSPKVEADSNKHPLLRRWDHKGGDRKQGGLTISDGAAAIVEGEGEKDEWLILEDGAQIQFQKSANEPNQYRTGDYWLIPARTATGDVEWPGPANNPDVLSPHGVRHHYAPLAVITLGTDGNVTIPAANGDLRRKFEPLGKPA